MKGLEVITAIKAKFRVKTDVGLSEVTGLSIPAIHVWKNRPKVTPRQFAGLVHSASKTGAVRFQANIIRPLVEFFPIDSSLSRGGASWELFATKDSSKKDHPFLRGLRDELEAKSGVYVFFDSRGQAIYAGKARKQSLWKEMNLAFNRERGDIQTIKRVKHPERKQPYKNSDEKARQIFDNAVPLSDLAHYFSAYDITDALIEDVEALLVRSFANNLLNKRMERFGRHRADKKSKQHRKRRVSRRKPSRKKRP